MRYSQYINKQQGWTGHLWQGRCISSALDDAHTYSAFRHIERNPVEADIVKNAEDYKWSSAGFHCGLVESPASSNYAKLLVGIQDNEWMSIAESKAVTNILERNVENGLPCGSDSFIE